MKLILPATLQARIAAEARAALPRECCGLVLGIRGDDVAQVWALHPTRNLSPGEDSFQIDPQDHFAASRAARAAGQAVIGCYHSHPDGKAQPSARDLAGAGEEGFLWLIAGTALAAFVFAAGDFRAVTISSSS